MPASSDDSGTSESGANEDLKAKMREALDRKKQGGAKGLRGPAATTRVREKAHGSEVSRRRRAEDAPPQGRRPW